MFPALRYYTGVGSRSTPIQVLDLMTRIGRMMGVKGWVLRSGAAPGADSAFEAGADDVGGLKEIYLPWKGFEKHTSNLLPLQAAFKVVEPIHPAWAHLSDGARKLHARNVHQVLGKELSQPSTMVICWTRDGEEVGGTRTAIKVAQAYGVPVVNLGLEDARLKFEAFVREWESSRTYLH